MKRTARWLSVALAALAAAPAFGAPLFSDSFSTVGSAANYTQVASSADTAVTHAYDYGAFGIPAAPRTTDGSKLGLKMEANMAAPASIEAVTLHTNQVFSGRYKVRFDAWINANGPFPAGGAGSTEYLTMGIGGDGATVNRHNFSTASPSGVGSGAWFAADGEGQSSAVDYNALKGATFQLPATGEYAAGTTTGAGGARDNSNAYYNPLGPGVNASNLPFQGSAQPGTGFAQQNGTTQANTMAFRWRDIVIDVDPAGGTGGAGSATWYIDGLRIATLDAGANGAFSTTGRVTVGYLDAFTSVSNNAALSFGLVDNLTVDQIPEPGCLALVGCCVAALAAGRRRLAS